MRGTSITKKQVVQGHIPVVAGGREPAYYHNQANREGETISVAGSGAYAGHLTYWNEPIFISDGFSIKTDPQIALMKYVFYFLSSNQSKIYDMKRGGGVPHVYVKNLAPFRIPIPPLEKQKEIVTTLDQFDALVNDLSIGIPAEINARRLQLEYYQNKLLTFKEKP